MEWSEALNFIDFLIMEIVLWVCVCVCLILGSLVEIWDWELVNCDFMWFCVEIGIAELVLWFVEIVRDFSLGFGSELAFFNLLLTTIGFVLIVVKVINLGFLDYVTVTAFLTFGLWFEFMIGFIMWNGVRFEFYWVSNNGDCCVCVCMCWILESLYGIWVW